MACLPRLCQSSNNVPLLEVIVGNGAMVYVDPTLKWSLSSSGRPYWETWHKITRFQDVLASIVSPFPQYYVTTSPKPRFSRGDSPICGTTQYQSISYNGGDLPHPTQSLRDTQCNEICRTAMAKSIYLTVTARSEHMQCTCFFHPVIWSCSPSVHPNKKLGCFNRFRSIPILYPLIASINCLQFYRKRMEQFEACCWRELLGITSHHFFIPTQ